jgi:hypothetical protein
MTQIEKALREAVEGKGGKAAKAVSEGLEVRCKLCAEFGKQEGRGWCSKKKKYRARNAGDGCKQFKGK